MLNLLYVIQKERQGSQLLYLYTMLWIVLGGTVLGNNFNTVTTILNK